MLMSAITARRAVTRQGEQNPIGRRRRTAIAVVLALAAVFALCAAPASAAGWSAADSLTEARWGFTATQLDDGRVLVAGGVGPGGVITASVEIYNPATDAWSAADSLGSARAQHTATL